MNALEALAEWLRRQPKCPHDGTTSPCALCLLREKEEKEALKDVLRRMMGEPPKEGGDRSNAREQLREAWDAALDEDLRERPRAKKEGDR